jgi:2-polyprenyl-6-methoxyphenol hydroxylase-like FAD-dependent oxidoreductase
MRVAIVGAGPAGLYFARLLKRSHPDTDVHVHEQGPEGATWGFGVGLGGRTMAEIEASDRQVHDRMAAAMLFTREQRISLNGEAIDLEYAQATGAISRLELLNILIAACRDVGVELHFDATVDSADRLGDADLIVASDGANSRLRAERESGFGTERRILTNHFAWYGVGRRLYPSALVFRSFEGGTFIGHYYGYADGLSTFVAECDDATWQKLGFEAMSDDQRKAAIERVFAPELDGSPLVSNRSIWRRFPAVSNRHFHSGNIVLLGDSLRVAHFSIGSGTRLAMEDAAALHRAFAECGGNIPEVLPRFEQIRRPARDSFGEAARLSFEWYEDVARHMNQPLLPFVRNFLMRTGRISDERLRSYVPGFDEAYRHYCETVAG